jgi:hypothetical protein
MGSRAGKGRTAHHRRTGRGGPLQAAHDRLAGPRLEGAGRERERHRGDGRTAAAGVRHAGHAGSHAPGRPGRTVSWLRRVGAPTRSGDRRRRHRVVSGDAHQRCHRRRAGRQRPAALGRPRGRSIGRDRSPGRIRRGAGAAGGRDARSRWRGRGRADGGPSSAEPAGGGGDRPDRRRRGVRHGRERRAARRRGQAAAELERAGLEPRSVVGHLAEGPAGCVRVVDESGADVAAVGGSWNHFGGGCDG